jgi:Ni,Fe-hydrogenase maturation factor
MDDAKIQIRSCRFLLRTGVARLLARSASGVVRGRMKVYVFGNKDVPGDEGAIEVAEGLRGAVDGVSFVFVGPNEDVPFVDEETVVVLDVVHGMREVALISGDDIDRFAPPPRASVHDFDLAFQLKYLKKIGRLGEVHVAGIPKEGQVSYLRVISILRKLVAQDIQGS